MLPKKRKSFIKAHDLKEFVYCPRAWIYRQRRVKPRLPEPEVREVEQRLEDGWEYHREHGEAVCRASRQRRRAEKLKQGGLILAGLALALVIWRC